MERPNFEPKKTFVGRNKPVLAAGQGGKQPFDAFRCRAFGGIGHARTFGIGACEASMFRSELRARRQDGFLFFRYSGRSLLRPADANEK